jgi:PAS domain S-box-containing protein
MKPGEFDSGSLAGLRGLSLEVLHAVSQAIVAIDAHGTVVFFNQSAERLFGWRAAEIRGKSVSTLISPPQDGQLLALLSRFGGTGDRQLLEAAREAEAIRKDGSRVPCEMTAGEVTVGGTRLFIGFIRDITQRRQAEAELRTAKEAAETADRLKSEFLANMSHEIRTPMNAVIGMTGLLLDTPLSPEQRDFVETIRTSGDTLLTLINSILDFSKIEAGRFELDEEAFELRECVEESIDLVSAQAAEKGLELVYHVDDRTPAAFRGDVTRIRQVLVNLLSNAVKFTLRGEIVLEVGSRLLEKSRHEVEFRVSDTGIGIPPERIDRLFKSFSQVDSATTRQFGGTGLGLAISHQLVRLMGGTIEVESEVSRGSRFRFTVQAQALERSGSIRVHEGSMKGKTILVVDDNAASRHVLELYGKEWGMAVIALPSSRAALDRLEGGERFDAALVDLAMPEMDGHALSEEIRRRAAAETLPIVLLAPLGYAASNLGTSGAKPFEFAATLTKPIRHRQLREVLLGIFGNETTISRRARAETGLAIRLADRTPLRILLAEDNAVNQKVALKFLEKLGYRADVAGNGIEVLQALRRQSYDILLLDVQMPEMDGLEAARFIRAQWPDGKRPRIVAMTANAMAGDREKCLEAGMDDYISKPVQIQELQQALERWAPEAPAEAARRPRSWREKLIERLSEFSAMTGPGEPDCATDIVESFVLDVPAQIGLLRQSIEADEAQKFREVVHALKGMAANLGATRLAEVCRVLEGDLQTSRSLTSARGYVDAIEREFERLREFLGSRPWLGASSTPPADPGSTN